MAEFKGIDSMETIHDRFNMAAFYLSDEKSRRVCESWQLELSARQFRVQQFVSNRLIGTSDLVLKNEGKCQGNE